MIHYILISSLLEPTILDSGENYTLGRSPENKISLDSHLISRFHAKICWEKDHFGVLDRGARNGTQLNNVLLEPGEIYPLKDKDEIQIEPYVLRFRQAEGDLDLLLSLEIERLKLERLEDMIARLKDGRSFQSSLLNFRLSYILQILESTEKSGTLELRNQRTREGIIYLEKGRIIDVECGSLHGIEAATQVFGVKDGYFQFIAGDSEREPNFFCSTSQLMLKLFSILHPLPQNPLLSETLRWRISSKQNPPS